MSLNRFISRMPTPKSLIGPGNFVTRQPTAWHPMFNRLSSAYEKRTCGTPPSPSIRPSSKRLAPLDGGLETITCLFLHAMQLFLHAMLARFLHGCLPESRDWRYTGLGRTLNGYVVAARTAWGDMPVPHRRSYARDMQEAKESRD